MSAKIYRNDCDPAPIRAHKVTFVGCGNQGRIRVPNLRDSGVQVSMVGDIHDGCREQTARNGFPITGFCKTTQQIA